MLGYLSIACVACVAGGIVGARNKILAAEPLIPSGEAAKLFFPILLVASPLAYSGSAVKTLFRAPTIPPATQANLSADIICPEKRTVFRERSSRKTVSFKEQIMSKDKYLNILSCQMEAVVFIILQTFFSNTHGFENWGIFSDIPQF